MCFFTKFTSPKEAKPIMSLPIQRTIHEIALEQMREEKISEEEIKEIMGEDYIPPED